MNQPYIDIDKCTGCGECVRTCPQECIEIIEGKAVVDIPNCAGCSACATICPNYAISMVVETQIIPHQEQPRRKAITVNPKNTSSRATGFTIGKIAKFLLHSSIALFSSPHIRKIILGLGSRSGSGKRTDSRTGVVKGSRGGGRRKGRGVGKRNRRR